MTTQHNRSGFGKRRGDSRNRVRGNCVTHHRGSAKDVNISTATGKPQQASFGNEPNVMGDPVINVLTALAESRRKARRNGGHRFASFP